MKQAPEVKQVDRYGETAQETRHPAYGQISASRVSGERVLYGSDFRHRNFVQIRIHSQSSCSQREKG